MKCPVCGGAELVPNTKKLVPFAWRGRETMLECVGDGCPVCGEVLLTDDGEKLFEEQVLAFKASVKDDYPAYIKFVRDRLGLTQKEAGEIFGGGVNAFSRYELGKVSPPLSLVVLFQLLEKHPDLLTEIRRPLSVMENGQADDGRLVAIS